LPLILMLITSG